LLQSCDYRFDLGINQFGDPGAIVARGFDRRIVIGDCNNQQISDAAAR